ncbi:MAG: DEAD/DEAH box helicase family protein [Chloroflexi bacterium]|nr:DEAD/DEAH box helicase family protein [Chloroflexota bacterium]
MKLLPNRELELLAAYVYPQGAWPLNSVRPTSGPKSTNPRTLEATEAVSETEELEVLRRHLIEVTAERDRLRVDNRRLRRRSSRSPQEARQLSLPLTDPGLDPLRADAEPVPALPLSGNCSPLSNKVRLFHSLFRGREDVFARLWWSSKSQKTGYSPVCKCFGNLIALPLQKEPVERGNTLFLDDSFRPHQDQWAFLASLERMEPSALEGIVREAVRRGQVIGVRASLSSEEEQPWVLMPSRSQQGPPLTGPVPGRIKAVKSNLIYVEKEGLSSQLLNRIKRLAAFQNPEFYKRQSLRLSTALTPRVICCAEEFSKHLAIPRGCSEELQEMLGRAGIELDIGNECFQGTKISVSFRGQLKPEQQTSASQLMHHNDGVLVAPSGYGKTVVGISLIASRGVNSLVLVHRRPLMEQWRAQLANFLDVPEESIGQIGGGKTKQTGFIDIAMFPSLIRKGRVEDLVAGYGQVIVDECHHLPAVTFEQVLRQVKARYVVGLTATPYRRDGQQPIILMQCGPVRHVIGQKDAGHERTVMHRLLCRNTAFAISDKDGGPSIHEIYSALIDDEPRNQLILGDMLQALDEGRSPILLTERRRHLEFFVAKLAKSVPHVIVLQGGLGIRQRRAVAEQLATIPPGEKRVLLATGRYIGEGFDDARLDTLFLAMPVSWKGTLVQYAGRLHRLYAGKTEVRIYDYADRDNRILMRMFQKRLRGYRAMGYETSQPDTKRNART